MDGALGYVAAFLLGVGVAWAVLRLQTKPATSPGRDFEPACILHESRGPLLLQVPRAAPTVRLVMQEQGETVYREFYLTGDRDGEGRPIYRGDVG